MIQYDPETPEIFIEEDALTEWRARQIVGMSGSVKVRANSLSCDAARILAGFCGKALYFEGLPHLSDDRTISELGRLGTDVLQINNNESPLRISDWTLSTESFFLLAPYTTNIVDLAGYTLSSSDARKLANYNGYGLNIIGHSIDAKVARGLVAAQPQCLWCHFDTLGADAARELANSRAWEELVVFVTGGVDKVVAEAISRYQGESLHLIIDNQPEAVRALTCFTGKLLVAIEHLSPQLAAALAGCKCTQLSLPYLEHIDTDSARELAKIQCLRLSLEGVESLSASTAKELAKYVEVEEEWISLAMPHNPDEFVSDAMTLMGSGNPPLRPVDDDRGIAKVMQNPRRLFLQGLSASVLSDEAREIFAPHRTKVVFRTEFDDGVECMEESEEPGNHTHKDNSRDRI